MPDLQACLVLTNARTAEHASIKIVIDYEEHFQSPASEWLRAQLEGRKSFQSLCFLSTLWQLERIKSFSGINYPKVIVRY